MRKKNLIGCIAFFIFLLTFFSPMLKAVVNWHNDMITASVANEDIDVIGTNTLVGIIKVSATAADVRVTISNGDAIITNLLMSGTASQLQLRVDNDHKITFDLTDSLSFQGAQAAGDEGDLLITMGGNGQVIFDIGDGKKIAFTSSDTSAGTQAYAYMDEQMSTAVIFQRQNTASDEHVEILIGKKSLLSYLSQGLSSPFLFGTNEDKGLIIFDPANSVNNTGRMVLRVLDTGGVYVGGNRILDKDNPSLYNIRLDEIWGLEARMLVRNNINGSQSSLLILNENKTRTDLHIDPFEEESFDGELFGFILGPNGVIQVDDSTYIDYVGLTNNFCFCPEIPDDVLFCREVWSVIKPRNGSAFIVDGDPDYMFKAKIEMGDHAAIYFRSGVSRYGQVHELDADNIFSFTVDNLAKSCGPGEMVLDVEGWLDVVGGGNGAINALQILSLEVTFTGGSILIDSNETTFPKRNFAKDCCGYNLSYNKAYWFLNNRMNLYNTWLVHTDENHKVCESNDVCSEPTYVGGEKIKICCDGCNLPKIAFYNTPLYVHTNIAFTGLDLFVPNLNEEIGNDVYFKFFNNGSVIDDGTGRHMILGTFIGSYACDGTIVDPDTNLDVFQDAFQTDATDHNLAVRVGMNNSTIIEGVPNTPVCDQMAVHTLYLGHSSNITVGGDSWVTGVETLPTFSIQGNFFSFETRGGCCCSPENSSATGQGGIFVDTNGSFIINDQYRANMGAMVTKSDNGYIYLPKGKVFFDARVGIADCKLDLAQSFTIIPKGAYITDYTFNWQQVTKDYGNYCPYQICSVEFCMACSSVTTQNITSLPTVLGTVEQFQIKGSRLANPASIMIDNGYIRELVFLTGCYSAEAPTAFLVLQNQGRVGIGSTHKNTDSLFASIFLGVNGVTIVPNGGCQVDINEDVIINDVCHILKGPNFGAEENKEVVLKINSDSGTKIRVLESGILDLSSFTQPNQVVDFSGDIQIILEPGARIRMGGGKLRFSDNARVICTSVSDLTIFPELVDSYVNSTDPVRVDFIGTGTVEFKDCAVMDIEKWAYVGVTSSDECSTGPTNLLFWLQDDAKVAIGGVCGNEGGVFQIGNTEENLNPVNFQLIIDGPGTVFSIGNRSVLGLASGVANNLAETSDLWLVGNLFDVETIKIFIRNGIFSHNRIFSGDEKDSSLLLIAETGENIYSFNFATRKASILGGGNMFLVDAPFFPVFPEVLDEKTDEANIMSSKNLIYNLTALQNPLGGYMPEYYDISKKNLTQERVDILGNVIDIYAYDVSATHLFDLLGIVDLYPTGITWWSKSFSQQFVIYGAAGSGDKNLTNIGFIYDGAIIRFPTEFVRHPRFVVTAHEHTHELASVGLDLRPPQGGGAREVFDIFELY